MKPRASNKYGTGIRAQLREELDVTRSELAEAKMDMLQDTSKENMKRVHDLEKSEKAIMHVLNELKDIVKDRLQNDHSKSDHEREIRAAAINLLEARQAYRDAYSLHINNKVSHSEKHNEKVERQEIMQEMAARKQYDIEEQALKNLDKVAASIPNKKDNKGKEEIEIVAQAIESSGDKKLVSRVRTREFSSDDINQIKIPDASPSVLNSIQSLQGMTKKEEQKQSNQAFMEPVPDPKIAAPEKPQSGLIAAFANIGNAIQTGARNIFNAIRDRIAGSKESVPEITVIANSSHIEKSSSTDIMNRLHDKFLDTQVNHMLDKIFGDEDSTHEVSRQANQIVDDIFKSEEVADAKPIKDTMLEIEDSAEDESEEKFFHTKEEPDRNRSKASEEASKLADDIFKDDDSENNRNGPGLR